MRLGVCRQKPRSGEMFIATQPDLNCPSSFRSAIDVVSPINGLSEIKWLELSINIASLRGFPDRLVFSKIILTIGLIALLLLTSSCGRGSAETSRSSSLTEDEKHRLYAAALAASESPLDTNLFRQVCTKIDIADTDGKPNDNYLSFVSRHVEWGTKAETDEFRQKINTKEKARAYIDGHLPQ